MRCPRSKAGSKQVGVLHEYTKVGETKSSCWNSIVAIYRGGARLMGVNVSVGLDCLGNSSQHH
eukprot:scaffold489331_cov15-Prasinocladus_malaysianus.AAC.1